MSPGGWPDAALPLPSLASASPPVAALPPSSHWFTIDGFFGTVSAPPTRPHHDISLLMPRH
jgi:hypothetical protein